MKYKFLGLFLLIFSVVFSQSITGIVVDQNGEPLPGTTVYFDGSSYGTTTNLDGRFRLSIPAKMNSALIFSFVGFEKAYLTDIDFNKTYKVILIESVEQLKEVVVSDNKFTRKQMLSIFRSQFLGLTKAGKSCKILNEDELYFSYDNKNFILTTYADKPLVVDNPYLGYKVYFDLEKSNIKFSQYSIQLQDVYSSIYGGTSRFEEIETTPKKNKNRAKVYKGSITEFFRNLASNKWNKNHFLLFKGSFPTNPTDHFTLKDTLNSTLVSVKKQELKARKQDFVAEFNLLYDNKEQSKIIFSTDTFLIDQYGLFTNYDKILFSGALGDKRVGDLLPSNYGIE